ncbi:SDR family oxidoreductase [Pararobbsia alpina]|uniref:SDR family NAD(P)-dependent oxidoreductase n=1 Tax=Pararobbsia alpina TaxID=621374 RepID=UPI0039A5D274
MTQRKVAIVTGASQGIGAGVVDAYRKKGYVVIANSRSIKQSDDDGVVAVAGDIRDREVADRVVQIALERFGRIDTLINNAGIFIGKPFTDYTPDDYRNVMGVNVEGFFNITQPVLRQMVRQGSGHIVQITATVVHQGIAGAPAGLAMLSKGGLYAVTGGLAIEYAKQGIRVNAVAPGVIKTPMHPAEKHALLDTMHPIGRMGEVSEIVDAIMYLEDAAFVTGQTINVDGGRHAGRW